MSGYKPQKAQGSMELGTEGHLLKGLLKCLYAWVCVCVYKGSTEGDFRDTTPLLDWETGTDRTVYTVIIKMIQKMWHWVYVLIRY